MTQHTHGKDAMRHLPTPINNSLLKKENDYLLLRMASFFGMYNATDADINK